MDYSIPPWLTEKQGFGASLAQGASAGAAIGRNFMQAREQAMQESLMPLRQQAMRNQIEETTLDIHTKQNMQADYLASKRALSDFSDKVARISDDDAWDDMSRMGDLADSIKSHPELLYNQSTAPFVKSAFQRFMDSKKLNYNFSQLDEKATHNQTMEELSGEREEGRNYRAKISADSRITAADLRAQREAAKGGSTAYLAHYADDLKDRDDALKTEIKASESLYKDAKKDGDQARIRATGIRYRQALEAFNSNKNKSAAERERRLAAHGIKLGAADYESAPADETQEAPRDRGREDMSPMIAPDDPREGKIGVAKDGKRYRITNGVPVLIQ
jgi:hypothetical protein